MAPEKCTGEAWADCPASGEIQALKKSLEAHKEQSAETHREIFHRLNEVERGAAVMDERYKTILDKLDALTVKVDALEAKPAKRWEQVVEKLLLTAIGAVVLYLLARIGIA